MNPSDFFEPMVKQILKWAAIVVAVGFIVWKALG